MNSDYANGIGTDPVGGIEAVLSHYISAELKDGTIIENRKKIADAVFVTREVRRRVVVWPNDEFYFLKAKFFGLFLISANKTQNLGCIFPKNRIFAAISR